MAAGVASPTTLPGFEPDSVDFWEIRGERASSSMASSVLVSLRSRGIPKSVVSCWLVLGVSHKVNLGHNALTRGAIVGIDAAIIIQLVSTWLIMSIQV